MFEQFMTFLASLNDNVIWGIPMVVLMIGTGLFLLIVTKGVIFRHFGIEKRKYQYELRAVYVGHRLERVANLA